MPVWLLAGCADWLCHRASHIETTTGANECLLHLLMFAVIGLPLLAAIFLQINAGIIAFMIIAFFNHEATAFWDVSYAVTARDVTPIEQHVHSFLELIPLMAVLFVVTRHWDLSGALRFLHGPCKVRPLLERGATAHNLCNFNYDHHVPVRACPLCRGVFSGITE